MAIFTHIIEFSEVAEPATQPQQPLHKIQDMDGRTIQHPAAHNIQRTTYNMQYPMSDLPTTQIVLHGQAGIQSARPVQDVSQTVKPESVSRPLLPSYLSPGILKLVLLIPVFLTALEAKAYTGDYQLLINNHVVGIFYVLFGSLVISSLFFWWRPWQAVLASFTLMSILKGIQFIRMPFIADHPQRGFFANIFGATFDPVDFIYYGSGAVLALLILWLLHTASGEKYTEVY